MYFGVSPVILVAHFGTLEKSGCTRRRGKGVNVMGRIRVYSARQTPLPALDSDISALDPELSNPQLYPDSMTLSCAAFIAHLTSQKQNNATPEV